METLEVNHGNIYINFGAPLSVAEYLFNRSRTIFHSSLHERVVLTKDRLKEVRALSYKVSYVIFFWHSMISGIFSILHLN